MTVFQETLQHISVGQVQRSGRLSVFPLLSSVSTIADYTLLDSAQAEGLATVSEISEGGSVPELLLDNASELSLFLLDGEELLGAKQNRIVNLSLLVPGGTKQTIPVSCVEAGRWNYDSEAFKSSDRTFFASGRARKSADVTGHMGTSGSRRTDQGAVWDDVSFALSDFKVASETSAVSALYDSQSGSLDEFEQAFAITEGQVGAVFAIDGEVRGMELFDATSTWQALMPKVLRSYAIDALRADRLDAPAGDSADAQPELAAREFLDRVASAHVERFEALGEGSDLRVVEDSLSGGGLFAKDRIVHLCAFAMDTGSSTRQRQQTMELDF
ncbi:ARPP-1 family domain-containing protein [Congregibacter litoralis]|uniref:ARPP-1 family domain-containing protein n=1 Tax=Congregibacter litoralis TaxID=393662 RepID=UPI00006BE051|nr:DUF6569 family protein [Congregibacter litoralis]